MAYIGKQPLIGNFQVCDAISTVDGQAAYTLQVGGANVSPETANNMIVSVNGVIQKPTASYTVSGSTITFTSNLVTGDVIDFIQILGNVLDLGVPSDNTVSLAKLSATGTKDATTFLRGDNTFASAGGGKVLQVVNATDSTKRTTTSSSFVTASNTLSIDITPSATSSKILILVSSTTQTTNDTGFATIYRDSTNLGNANGLVGTQADKGENPTAMIYLDSPNTTSATTYQVYIRSTGSGVGTISLNGTFSPASTGSIIAMEIGA